MEAHPQTASYEYLGIANCWDVFSRKLDNGTWEVVFEDLTSNFGDGVSIMTETRYQEFLLGVGRCH